MQKTPRDHDAFRAAICTTFRSGPNSFSIFAADSWSAAAESAAADVLLTTDDRFLKRTARKLGNPRIPVQNPLSWIKEQGL